MLMSLNSLMLVYFSSLFKMSPHSTLYFAASLSGNIYTHPLAPYLPECKNREFTSHFISGMVPFLSQTYVKMGRVKSIPIT